MTTGSQVTEDTVIGTIVRIKGPEASKLIHEVFCGGGNPDCLGGATLRLNYAAKLLGKTGSVEDLVTKLNALPTM